MRHCLDPAAVPLDDLLADRQSDAIAGIFGAGMQSLENDEDVLGVLLGYTNAVVGHREDPFRTLFLRRDLNDWGLGATKLDGVSDKVLEHLLQL